MTQGETILKHIQEHGTITSIEAFEMYGITRLSGRIYDLRLLGHDIVSQSCKTKNRYGKIVYYSKYFLRKN